jgi:hypothetical protein
LLSCALSKSGLRTRSSASNAPRTLHNDTNIRRHGHTVFQPTARTNGAVSGHGCPWLEALPLLVKGGIQSDTCLLAGGWSQSERCQRTLKMKNVRTHETHRHNAVESDPGRRQWRLWPWLSSTSETIINVKQEGANIKYISVVVHNGMVHGRPSLCILPVTFIDDK